jgi:hypothetical protein
MSLPVSATNNQTAVINGVTYIYSLADNTWTRIQAGIGNLTLANANVYNNLTSNLSVLNNVFVQSGLFWAGNGISIPSTGAGSGGPTYTTGASAPTVPSPNPGDQWYDTVNDILYEYVNDGTTSYWIDIQSPTTYTDTLLNTLQSNISVAGNVSTGNLSVAQSANIGGNLISGNLTTTSLTVTGNITNANITANLSVAGNINSGNVNTGTITSLVITATGNVISGNVQTGNLTVTNNISGTNISATNVTTTNFNSDNIVTGNITFSGVLSGGTILNMFERANVIATAPPATTNIDLLSGTIIYYTGNATTNITANVRGNSTVAANTVLSTNQSSTLALLIPQASPGYIVNSFVIDNISVAPVWQGGAAPITGSPNSIDIYTFTIIKTESATFKVFATKTQFQHTG